MTMKVFALVNLNITQVSLNNIPISLFTLALNDPVKKSTVCSLHVTLRLHFTPDPQSAICIL